MAEIIPFRAWRYNAALLPDISPLVSPLFDVISKKQRDKLYENPYNSIHLSVPQGADSAQTALHTLQRWQQEGILQRDETARIYPYYQYFNLHNDPKTYCRKGFICMIKAHFWEEKAVLRHENTLSEAVNDRTRLLEATQLNSSATHGLYHDPDFLLEAYMDNAIQHPLYETEDYQGVRDVLGVIDDEAHIEQFVRLLAEKTVILADGHHRYESSLAYRRQQITQNEQHTGKEPYNYHMMYLTNSASDHLKILPTHRLLEHCTLPSLTDILAKVTEYFHVLEVENASELSEVIAGKKWAFGLLHPEGSYKMRLKPEVFPQLAWQFPDSVKQMDLTVLHYFFIEKVLGIVGKHQRNSSAIRYERNYAECLRKIAIGEAQLALITNEISIEQVNEICFSGDIMPPKSTYFYPKTIGGFVFGSLES